MVVTHSNFVEINNPVYVVEGADSTGKTFIVELLKSVQNLNGSKINFKVQKFPTTRDTENWDPEDYMNEFHQWSKTAMDNSPLTRHSTRTHYILDRYVYSTQIYQGYEADEVNEYCKTNKLVKPSIIFHVSTDYVTHNHINSQKSPHEKDRYTRQEFEELTEKYTNLFKAVDSVPVVHIRSLFIHDYNQYTYSIQYLQRTGRMSVDLKMKCVGASALRDLLTQIIGKIPLI